MAPRKAGVKETTADFEVQMVRTGCLHFRVIGISPLIYNCVSNKARQQLLLPRGRKTAADKLANLKHDPYAEYLASTYKHRTDDQPTRLFFTGGGMKKAIENATKDIPGVARSAIARLMWVREHDIPIWGVPQLYMTVTRSADINHTPDMRTRAIVPQWCSVFSVQYVQPQVSDTSVINLVNAAGLLCGIGDGRQEKGRGHGQFKIVSADDEEAVRQFDSIIANGGRAAQDEALAHPSNYDLETDEMITWYDQQITQMGDRFARPKLAAVA